MTKLQQKKNIKLIDISTHKSVCYSGNNNNDDKNVNYKVDYSIEDIIPDFNDTVATLDRNDAVVAVSNKVSEFIINEHNNNKVCGVIGLGGSCGTSIQSLAFKMLPLGIPKIIISTVAATPMGTHYIGHSDLILIPSIVDVSGINDVFKTIVENAASAIVGMSQNYLVGNAEKVYEQHHNVCGYMHVFKYVWSELYGKTYIYF